MPMAGFRPRPTRPSPSATARSTRSCGASANAVIPVVTNRDLRRTWKTLAGKAGLSKEIRDRLQYHTLQDVSSKSYDRWNYMPEKRAAIKKWNTFVRTLLSKKRPKAGREMPSPMPYAATEGAAQNYERAHA
jgi:hypothetical protein